MPSRSDHVGLLFELVDFARHASRRSVHASSGDLAAPSCGTVAKLAEVRAKLLSGKPSLAHVGDLILHARLVLRTANARRVDEEASPLRVFEEGAIEHRLGRMRMHHRRRHVVGHDALDDATEEAPCRFESLDEGRARLHERRPHEHVPAHRERHHEHPELSTCPVVFRDVAHLAEVDLRFIGGRWIVDSHRDRPLAPSERFVREATQRRVRDRNAVSREQLVHPHQTQRWVAAQPLLDAKSMQLELFARRGRSCQRASLYALRDLPDDAVGQLGIAGETASQCGLDVAARRLSIGDAVARDLHAHSARIAICEELLERRSWSTSRKLIGTSRRRPAPSSIGTVPLLSVVEPGLRSQEGAGPMTLAIGWPHGLGVIYGMSLAGGPITPAIGWPHEGGENPGTWPHERGVWQIEALRPVLRRARSPATRRVRTTSRCEGWPRSGCSLGRASSSAARRRTPGARPRRRASKRIEK